MMLLNDPVVACLHAKKPVNMSLPARRTSIIEREMAEIMHGTKEPRSKRKSQQREALPQTISISLRKWPSHRFMPSLAAIWLNAFTESWGTMNKLHSLTAL